MRCIGMHSAASRQISIASGFPSVTTAYQANLVDVDAATRTMRRRLAMFRFSWWYSRQAFARSRHGREVLQVYALPVPKHDSQGRQYSARQRPLNIVMVSRFEKAVRLTEDRHAADQ